MFTRHLLIAVDIVLNKLHMAPLLVDIRVTERQANWML
jgi:hypothetical protein